MKKLLLLSMFAFACSSSLWAQQASGRVTNEDDGSGIAGASITKIGSTVGVFSDDEGNFTISASEGDKLSVSFVGFETEIVTVGSGSISVSLMPVSIALDDVVITAIGIERNKKALGYSVTEVDGSSFVEAREVNIANSLAGKVAGVNVSNLSTGPQGSSRVIIRGNVSLTGNNQPLYIVDGIPIDNSSFGQAGLWGGYDEGDGMSSINPDDIASITVLKGANAAALYGSRASNGVILITTKSGKTRKGLGVEFNSNFVFDRVINNFDLQKEYGHGRDGMKPIDAQDAWTLGNGSNWGSRLDGSMVAQFDGVSRPYTYQSDDNINRFYRTGSTWTNTIGLSGGNANHSIRLNISDLQNESPQPNSGFTRRNASTSYTGKFGERLTVTSKIMYSFEDAKNRPRIADSPGNSTNALFSLPANYNVDDLRGDPDKPGAVPAGFVPVDGKITGEEMQISNNLWNANPWWAAYQFENTSVRDRIITSNVAKFEITDFLFVQGRVGMDYYTRRRRNLTPYGTGYQRRGSLSEEERRVREVNIEGLIGFDDNYGDISINAFVAANRMRTSSEVLNLGGSNFNIPFFHAFPNLANQSPGYGFGQEGINSVYGSATIGYKDYLYLTGSARNDWFSTLSPESNQILYPSIGGSLVFSEMFDLSGRVLTFGKLRASWAQVGGDTDPYNLVLTYGLGQGHLGQPNANIQQSNLPNAFLVPLTSSELEVGVDLRFLENRLSLDMTYYSQTTTNDILAASIAPTSGFNGSIFNIGEMKNTGFEILLTGRPVQRKDFNWDINFNVGINNNEVISLAEGIDEIRSAGGLGEPRTRLAFIFNVVGEPFGTIKGFTQEMINGVPVFNPENGQPVRTTELSTLGNGVHKYTGGITNSINWKGIYADFLIDFKAGAEIYSGTNVRLVGSGDHKMTVEPHSGLGYVSEGREKITVTGVTPDGEAFTKVLDATETDGFWGAYSQLSDRFIYDASFAKLRQVSVGYSLPQSIIGSTPLGSVRISFVARNLALLYSQLENVDPESVYNNSNAQGLDYFSFPQTRSYGLNLKFTF